MNMLLRRSSRKMVTTVTQGPPRLVLLSKNLAQAFEAHMFNHTQNDNGTYNTRCLHCFMTVASSVESTEELERLETMHTCPEKALSDLLARGPVARPRVHLH